MKAFVAFVCERLSLAIVAIGSIFMLLVFLTVEYTAPLLGDYGISFRGNTDVVNLDSGVKQGDLQDGDRIDLSSLTPRERFTFISVRSNETLNVTAIRGDHRFPVTLSAAPPAFSRSSELARLIGIPICFFLSLGLASALFLMRPRAATLAFYLYTILMLLKVYQTPLQLAAWPVNLLSFLVMQIVYPATQIAALVVAQRLYGKPGGATRWFLGASLAAAVPVFFIWLNPILWLTFQRYGLPGRTRLLEDCSDVVLLAIVLCGMAYSASGSQESMRRRVTWIVSGIALAPMLDLTWALTDMLSALVRDSSFELLALARWTDALLPWGGLIGIVAVFYGFLSQRVIDFRIAIGRAALYGGTTIALVVIFGSIEWLAEQLFETTRPALYASLAAALGIGFAIRALNDRIEGFLDNLFFHDQRKAEEALKRAARALANTTSEKTVVDFLIDEPVAVLGLQSGALFLARGEGHSFERVAAQGWTEAHAERFDAEDPLIVTLRAEMGPVQLEPRMLEGMHLPGGDRLHALAVPLIMRGNVFGFVFYGERKDGASFTTQERDLLAAIATSAAAAYDHIDADRARERIRALEQRLQGAATAVVLVLFCAVATPARAQAQTIAPLCHPRVGAPQTVVTAAQRLHAAKHAIPPLVDIFAWPDGPFGVLPVRGGAAFFATDGGTHRNGKAGSMTMTFGTLANPLGSGTGAAAPIDSSIRNDLGLNPAFRAYNYIGAGPVYLVPPGLPGAGNLLAVYHAERNTTGAGGFYSLLGLARSTDGGRSWHDLGEIVQANQPYRRNLQGYDIGMSQIAVDPTQTYFYVYFADWIANGTVVPSTQTVMSVARVGMANVLAAAFAPKPRPLPPWKKYYRGTWDQPGINGLSTDLEPGSQPGAPSVTYDTYLKRYVVIADDTQNVSYGESPDGLAWTARQVIFSAPSTLYARAIGTGTDPTTLGARFYAYYTRRVNWTAASVRRFAVSCG